MASDVCDLYDHEVEEILQLQKLLTDKARYGRHNYTDFEREIRERFAGIGFAVEVSWYGFSVGGQPQDGAMPEVTVTGRTDQGHVFDKDRQVHEVTHNVLGIPGEEGIIKADPDTLKSFTEGNGGRGHGHGHSH